MGLLELLFDDSLALVVLFANIQQIDEPVPPLQDGYLRQLGLEV